MRCGAECWLKAKQRAVALSWGLADLSCGGYGVEGPYTTAAEAERSEICKSKAVSHNLRNMSAMKTDKPLCERIFAESKKIHTVSNGLVQSKLLALFSDRVLYGEAISCFYFVFKALENAIEDALTTNRSDGQ